MGAERKWRVALLAALAGLGLVLAGELVAARLLPDAPPALRLIGGDPRPGYLCEDPDTAYGLASGYRESASHAGAYATGTWSGRGGPPPPGTDHTALFGDSCAYGVGVRPAESLAARIETALAQLGDPAARVVNHGVPGFSTTLALRRARTVLREQRPRAAVFYLSSWNDQAAARGAPDDVVLARLGSLRDRIERSALARLVRSWRGERRSAAVEADRGTPGPSSPPRVSHEQFAGNVRAFLAACRDAGVEPVLVLPAYPRTTLEGHPRLEQDRERARRIAVEEGVLALDARRILDAAGLSDGLSFVDFVHPSAAAHATLGKAVAEVLAERIRAATAPTLSIRSIRPERACALGDVAVTLEVDGLSPNEVPVLLVGSAPLLDVRALGDGRFEGLLMANAPGRHDVVVQGREGVARRSLAIELWEPHIALEEGGRLVLRARPGDEAVVVAAAGLLAEPIVEPRGSAWLDPATLTGSFPVTADAAGRAAVPLAPEDPGRWLQALVTPRGGTSYGRRYSALFERPDVPR